MQSQNQSTQVRWPFSMQIRGGGGQQSPYYAELEAAKEKAEASSIGLWTKASIYLILTARTLPVTKPIQSKTALLGLAG